MTQMSCACQLRDLIKERPVIVNLIPYNPFDGNPHDYRTPSPERVDAFLHVLEEAGIRVFERRHHGRDIAAACGQLAKISSAPVADIENCCGKLAKERIRAKYSDAARAKDKTRASLLSMTPQACLLSGLLAVSMTTVLLMRWNARRR